MRGLAMTALGSILKIHNLPIPVLKSNQVLVKMNAAPINPSDIGYVQGIYGNTKATHFPCVPGFEGVGIVDKVYDSCNYYLIGKRVSVYNDVSSKDYVGTFAEFTRVEAHRLIELSNIPHDEQAACANINPMTALGFLHICSKEGHKSVIQTAAASQVGKIFLRLCLRNNINVINIIRKEEEANEIRQFGTKLILNYMESDFIPKLQKEISEYQPSIVFNAVGNDLTSKLLKELPNDSQIVQYANITLKPLGEFYSEEFLFKNKSIKGYWFSKYLDKLHPLESKLMRLYIGSEFDRKEDNIFKSSIQKVIDFSKYEEAKAIYLKNMTKGKVVLKISH